MRCPIKLNRDSAFARTCRFLPNRADPRKLLESNASLGSFEARVASFQIGRTWKHTEAKRHLLSDKIVAGIASACHKPVILEVGTSSGITSLELIEKLHGGFGRYYATDICLDVDCIGWPAATYFYDPLTEQCIMRVTDRFVTYGDIEGAPFPLAAVAARLIAHAPPHDPAIAQSVSLVRPELLRLSRRDPRVVVLRYDVMAPWPHESVDVVKVANVLNRVYFPDQQIAAAVTNLNNALNPGGRLVITDNRASERVSTFRKIKSGLELETTVNGGAGIADLVAKLYNRRPSAPSVTARKREVPCIPVQVSRLRKKRFSRPSRVKPGLRVLLAIEALITNGLLRAGVNSRIVTLSWFLVGLLACGVIATGRPWSFALGACLLYLAVILDLADGAIGRFEKQFMSVEKDIETHMKGIYLDRIQHAVASPFLGLALGWGVYQLSGNQRMILCGMSVALFHLFFRFNRILQEDIPALFRDRICRLLKDGRTDRSKLTAQSAPHFLTRLFGTLYVWGSSCKRFGLLLMAFGLLDWLSVSMFETAWAMEGLMVALGILCPCVIVATVARMECGNFLFVLAQQTLKQPGESTSDGKAADSDR